MKLEDMALIIANIEYKDWSLFLKKKRRVPYIQYEFMEWDDFLGGLVKVKSRKWFLSKHMTESEIIQTALLAAITAEEHEARERFRYRGFKVFHPHFNVNDVINLIKDKIPDPRMPVKMATEIELCPVINLIKVEE